MTEPELHVAGDESALVDPDPFSMALGILGAVAGAGAWLEAHRMRISEREDRARALRTSWYACVRSVNFLESSVREFETHISEQQIETALFRFGTARLGFTTRESARSVARLSKQIDITKANLTENFDRLSDYLGDVDAATVHHLLHAITEELDPLPEDYRSLVRAADRAVRSLKLFLETIRQTHLIR